MNNFTTSKRMKPWIPIFILLGFSSSVIAAPASDWKTDKDLKFHLVYLSPNAASSSSKSNVVPALNSVPSYQPDISNIAYAGITGLGFPLPVRDKPESLTLYLKLYQWPKHLSASVSSRKTLDPFLLSQIPGGQELEQYVSDSRNVLLKFASIDQSERNFSQSSPLKVILPKIQADFDSAIPFSSIYVEPAATKQAASEKESVDISANGVRSFHESLLGLYRKVFLSFGQDEKTLYFAEVKRCAAKPEEICGVRIYSFPKAPLVFKNYLDLPMPQDPKNVFLSGLLLVKVTDYSAVNPIKEASIASMTANHERFASTFKPVWAHMLEVGSVFDRRETVKE